MQILADRVRSLSTQFSSRSKVDDDRYNELRQSLNKLLSMQSSITDFRTAYEDFDLKNVPPRQRRLFPGLMEWWDDRGGRSKNWRFYLPLILGLFGPVIGGIAVELISHLK